ncbi:MAG: hypothetical protein ACK5N8_01360 [Alphaproteobacteria bacterium]
MKLLDFSVTLLMCISAIACVARYVLEAYDDYSLKDFIKGKASHFQMQTSIRIFIRIYILFSIIVSVLMLFVDSIFEQYEDIVGINFIDTRFEFAFYVLLLRIIFFAIVISGGVVLSILSEKVNYGKIKSNVEEFSWKKTVKSAVLMFKRMWNWFVMKESNNEA